MVVDPEWFWARVEKSDGCWLWRGKVNGDGYGMVSLRSKLLGAHRAVWMLEVGPIPDGLCVLHRCDVRNCVRPDHLFLGTKLDNHRDMVAKGRARYVRSGVAEVAATVPGAFRGSKNARSKLTEETVKVVRRLWEDGLSHDDLAYLFGVSDTAIRLAITRKTWSHVP